MTLQQLRGNWWDGWCARTCMSQLTSLATVVLYNLNRHVVSYTIPPVRPVHRQLLLRQGLFVLRRKTRPHRPCK